MVYFSYLTEDAYVQTGEYTVEEYFRPGQHVIQRVENITSDALVATAFPYTVEVSGSHTVQFNITESGGTVAADVELTINGTAVYTESGVDETTVTVTQVLTLEVGDVVDTNNAAGDGTITVDTITINRGDELLPESFYREWATYATGRDDLLGYDPGAYGVGTPTTRRTIVVPAVKQVSLLYMNFVASTKEERVLVQYDGDLSALESAGIVGSGGSRITFTDEEYNSTFAAAGFNRYGYVMPAGMERSQVSELAVYTGDYVDTDGTVIEASVNLYLQPIYMYQERPMFDYVYMTGGWRGDLDSAETGISGHLFRWQGQFNSEYIAPINRTGSAIIRDGYDYYADASGNVISVTIGDTVTSQDGIEYENADAYNVRNYRRR